VNTKENPADCASRGVSVIGKFIDHQLWFRGPKFLWQPESTWPLNCNIDTTIGDEKNYQHYPNSLPIMVLKNFSNISQIGIDLKYWLNGS
jgi:hypothetical protein